MKIAGIQPTALQYLLFLYVFTIPFGGVWPHLIGSDPALTPDRIAGGLLAACFFAQVSVGRTALHFDLYDKLLLFVLVFLNVVCLSLQHFLSSIDSFGLPLFIALLEAFCIVTYLIAKNLSLTPRTVEVTLWVFAIAGLVNALEMASSVQTASALARYSGYSDSSNTAALYGGFTLLILLGNQLSGTGPLLLRTALLPASILLVGLALFTTQSRTALIAVAIAILVMVILSCATKRTRTTTLLVAVLFPTLGFLVAPVLDLNWRDLTYRVRRLDSDDELSSRALSGREELWSAYYAMARDAGFLGIGLAQSFPNSERYLAQSPNRYYAFDKAGVHNDYLLLLVETGLLGMTLYISCLFFLTVTLLRRYRNSQFQGMYLILISTTVYLAL